MQMLCDEHGFFLEIADVIRGAELTILKGTMELRSNKTWAHFIVEVLNGSKPCFTNINVLQSFYFLTIAA